MYVEDSGEDDSVCNNSEEDKADDAKNTDDDGSRPRGQLLARTWTAMACRARTQKRCLHKVQSLHHCNVCYWDAPRPTTAQESTKKQTLALLRT